MSQLYSRVFTQILDSSLAEDFEARHVFEDFLKVCTVGEYGGVVDITRSALARKFNMPLDRLNRAIAVLEAPDPQSRNKANGGRRLLRLDEHRDWGWQIANWGEYEAMKTRAQIAERVAKHRRERNGGVNIPERPKKVVDEAALSVVNILNSLTGRNYRPTASHLEMISARLGEKGVDLDGVVKMMKHRVALWGDDPKMREYLRPETLFRRSKFDSYYAAKDEPVVQEVVNTPEPSQHQENLPLKVVQFGPGGVMYPPEHAIIHRTNPYEPRRPQESQ